MWIKLYAEKHRDELWKNFNYIFGRLSCAIIIHNTENNQKYWLAHGGLPFPYHDGGIYMLDNFCKKTPGGFEQLPPRVI